MNKFVRGCLVASSVASVVIFGIMALAADPQIKITSWEAIGTADSQIAEVCGVVTGATQSPIFLEVEPDYNTKNPGSYHTFAGSDGNFCQVVRTLYGSIQVTLMGSTPSVRAVAQRR